MGGRTQSVALPRAPQAIANTSRPSGRIHSGGSDALRSRTAPHESACGAAVIVHALTYPIRIASIRVARGALWPAIAHPPHGTT